MNLNSLQKALLLEDRGVVSLIGAGGKTTLMFRLAKELARSGKTVLTTTTTRIFMPSSNQSSRIILSNSPEEIVKKARYLLRDHFHITVGGEYLPAHGKLKGLPPEVIKWLWETGLFDWIIVEADGAARRSLKAPASHEPVIPEITLYLIAIVGLDVVGKPLKEKWVFRAELFSRITGLPLTEMITESSIARALMHEMGMMKGSPPKALKCAFLNKADREGAQEIGQKIARILQERGRNKLDRVIIGAAKEKLAVRQWYDIENSYG